MPLSAAQYRRRLRPVRSRPLRACPDCAAPRATADPAAHDPYCPAVQDLAHESAAHDER